MTSPTIRHAKRIWDYLASWSSPQPSDAIVVCCSYDLRVCDYACQLLRSSVAPVLVLSGHTGNWTRHLWERPEAEVFGERAKANGIDPSRLIIERTATNIGENIAFSRQLIPQSRDVTLVTKPNTILRVQLTAPIQWPGVKAHVACPSFSFPDDVSNVIGVFGVINEMVGDIQRILEYPSLGYQVEHTLPPDVMEAWESLVQGGFTQHMMKSNRVAGN